MIDPLRAIFGPERVTENERDLIAYSYDASGQKQIPTAVVFPKTADEIRKAILYCNRINASLIPRGFGTGTTAATIGSKAIILDMTSMNALYNLDKSARTADLEPGISLASLHSYLQKNGLTFPIRPYIKTHTTLGGVFARNDLSPGSYRLGRAIQHIKQLEYLDGTGKHYSLKDNFDRVVGCEGTTGIITRIIISLESVFTSTASITAYTDKDALLQAVSSLKRRSDILSIDYLNKKAATAIGLPHSHHLIIEYYSNAGDAREPADVNSILQKRDGIYDVLRLKGYQYWEDVSSDDILHLITICEEDDLPCFGPIGLSTLFFCYTQKDILLRSALHDLGLHADMHLGSAFGYGRTKKNYVPHDTKKKIIALKQEYDYGNILNRGALIDFR
ncbi:MAG: FAD-binding oxidoreductase [Nanoarchaeota archaeon]